MRKVWALVVLAVASCFSATFAQAVGNGNGNGATGNGGSSHAAGNGYNGHGAFGNSGAHPVPIHSGYQAAVLADHPYAYWRLRTTTGTEPDLGSGGNPLVYVGTGPRGGTALNSDTGSKSYSPGGSSSNYAIAASPLNNWPSTSAFTGEAWVAPIAADCLAGFVHSSIISQFSPTGPGWYMVLRGDSNNDGNCFFEGTIDGTNRGIDSPSGSILPGHTYHVVETFDKNNGGSVVYVNGQSVGTDSATYPTAWSATPGPFVVGQFASTVTINQVANNFTLNGSESDIAVYSTALSPARVLAHYNAGPLPSPTPSPSPSPSPTPIAYDATSACINNKIFTNDVLPPNVGEFSTHGLDTSYWGVNHSRDFSPLATWPPWQTSWGRHQYDTFFSDPSDGLGLPNPISMGTDTGAPGSPTALSILAAPVPNPQVTDLREMANDQSVITSSTAPFNIPNEGGTLTINVTNPQSAQIGWNIGIGTATTPITFIGKCISGCNHGNVHDGTNPWVIAPIHIYFGAPGTTIIPNSNDEGGIRTYFFKDYYSGVLDTNIDQEFGFFVARLRLPTPAPAISPAFWMLETGGVGMNGGQLLRFEPDIAEQFSNIYGLKLNAGAALWNSGPGNEYAYGCGLSCSAINDTAQSGATGVYPWVGSGDYASDYHDYGLLVLPGGQPPFPTDYSGKAEGVYVVNNSTAAGTTFFLDGHPIPGHIGGPDLTQGSPDKEVMLMFQVAAPGNWLDPKSQGASNTWPMRMWVQWLRVYRPTNTSC